MNILVATSEAIPFAKTGGLADVCGALPLELARQGHQTAVILPAYPSTAQQPSEPTGLEFDVTIGSKLVRGRILKSQFPHSDVPVYLVEQPAYFGRPALYGEQGRDYVDNCERFVFFSRAVLEAVRLLDLRPEIIHCNDWQTGLIPALLKIEGRGIPPFDQIGTLFTIHNLAYQGQFWHWDMLLTGIDWRYFNWQQMEFFGHLNLMKTGLVFADALNTVSPRYSQEIQTAPLGCGLEGVLVHRRDVLSGIINGVDYGVWSPDHDPHLPVTYTPETVFTHKPQCKAALQRELKLAESPDTPVVGFIGRLVEQKGIDLIVSVVERWTDADVQWVFLGSGVPEYQQQLARLAAAHPQKISATFDFCDPLAHRIEAGADMFLMPSRYEPCGLNQLYSLRYGTVPLVRTTGGLVDTITDTSEATLADGSATGFWIREHSPQSVAATLRRACDAYQRSDVWSRLVANGMAQDWSWTRSAREYSKLYEQILARKTLGVV